MDWMRPPMIAVLSVPPESQLTVTAPPPPTGAPAVTMIVPGVALVTDDGALMVMQGWPTPGETASSNQVVS